MFTIEKIKIKREDKEQHPHRAALSMIKAQGKFKCIGSGACAQVYGAKDSNIVYKVGEYDSSDGYVAYLKAIRKSASKNPFFPKIHGMRVYSNDHFEDIYVVAMERLTTLPRKMYSICDHFEKLVCDDYDDIGCKLLGIKTVMPKHLKHAITVLKNAKRSSRYIDFDLHDGNFMMRGSQIVVTDPLA